jgi:hypothetical protein
VSGLPYTRLVNRGIGQSAPFLRFGLGAIQAEPINSSTMPWIKQLDLRLTRGFNFGGTDWTMFADFRNVLNLRSVTRLFAETGDIVNEAHRNQLVDPSVGRLLNEAGEGGFVVENTDGTRDVALPADCNTWDAGPVNCVLLKRAEARFGNGDGLYAENEYLAAFNANYDLFNGTHGRLSAPRHVRIGFELRF